MKLEWIHIVDRQMPVIGEIVEDNGRQLKVKLWSAGTDSWTPPVSAYRDGKGLISHERPPLAENLPLFAEFASTWRCLFCDRGNYVGRGRCKKCNRPKAIAEAGPQRNKGKILLLNHRKT